MVFTTIDDFYVSDEALENSPSCADGVDAATELHLRRFGCQLIQEAGILLKYTQIVMATAQVIFHRFYCKKSMVQHHVKSVAAACLYLASKLEEEVRMCRELLSVFYRLERRAQGASLEPLDIFSPVYEGLKRDLFRTERIIMKTFGFIVHIDHPHKLVLNYLQLIFHNNAPPSLVQQVWGMTNDSLRTTLCVQLRAEPVACGIIFFAARRSGIPLPENPPWWELFSVTKLQLLKVAATMQQLYDDPPPTYVEVNPQRKAAAAAQSKGAPLGGSPQPSTGTGGVPAASGASLGGDGERGAGVEGDTVQATPPRLAGRREGEEDEGRPGSAARPASRYGETSPSRKDTRRHRDHSRDRGRDRRRDKSRDRDRSRDRSRDRDRGKHRRRQRSSRSRERRDSHRSHRDDKKRERDRRR